MAINFRYYDNYLCQYITLKCIFWNNFRNIRKITLFVTTFYNVTSLDETTPTLSNLITDLDLRFRNKQVFTSLYTQRY